MKYWTKRVRLIALLLITLIIAGCASNGTTGLTGGMGGGTTTAATTGTGGGQGTGGYGGMMDGGMPLPSNILDALKLIPGVLDFHEVPSELSGYRVFLITFDQPVDHANPDGDHFAQRLMLYYAENSPYDAPLVISTTGYELYPEYQWVHSATEALLNKGKRAHELRFEHRFFGESHPNPMGQNHWPFLTIEQTTKDTHALIQAINTVFSGKKFSTGVSKGGMTSVYDEAFYPGALNPETPFSSQPRAKQRI